jgi:hypothetical protein
MIVTLLDEVLKYYSYGFSMIPSGGGTSGKAPLIAWVEYQKRLPTIEELKEWEGKFHPHLWGVVTGAISRIFVIDCDTPISTGILESAGLSPQVGTPRGGSHFYFKHPGFPIKTVAGILPGVDCRGDGGFVNLIGGRSDGDYKLYIPLDNANFHTFKQLPIAIRGTITEAPQSVVSNIQSVNSPELPGRLLRKALAEVGNGNHNRNSTGLWLACQLRDSGLSQIDCEPFLLQYAGSVYSLGQPPYEIEEALASLESAFTRPPRDPLPAPTNATSNLYIGNSIVTKFPTDTKRDKNVTGIVTSPLESEISLSRKIEEWVKGTTGWWATDELDRDLSIRDDTGKTNRRQVLSRLKEQGVIEPHQKQNKMWRYINTKRTDILYKTVTAGNILPVKWPMGIETYVNLHPGNIAVVAGDQEAGKTALLLNFVKLNQGQFSIHYFCSEMGAEGEELRDRLDLFEGMNINDWTFEAHEQSANFEDVIVPDCINIIDYMEMTEELWTVNTHLTAISHKIGSGLAIVGLQKKKGERLGRGQEFSLEKPRLYLSMDKGKITIVKGKSWANRKVDPHDLNCHFKILDGCKFTVTEPWDWPKTY